MRASLFISTVCVVVLQGTSHAGPIGALSGFGPTENVDRAGSSKSAPAMLQSDRHQALSAAARTAAPLRGIAPDGRGAAAIGWSMRSAKDSAAVLGGVMKSTRSTAALNGNTMKHKP